MALNGHIDVYDHEALPTLCLLKRLKFRPQTVIDVGAAVGEWSLVCSRVFPHARYWLIDANEKARPFLQSAAGQIKHASLEIAALAEDRLAIPFDTMGYGTSRYPEDTPFRREKQTLYTRTLDEFGLASGSTILKIDAQGSELDILRGGQDTLANCDVVFIETSLLPYNLGSPLVHEVVAFLAERGFLLWDLGKDQFNRADGVPFQVNTIFVRKSSSLRSRKPFWKVGDNPNVNTDYLPVKLMPGIDRYVEDNTK